MLCICTAVGYWIASIKNAANRALQSIPFMQARHEKRLTWVDLFAVLQDLDGKEEGEHELVSLKQATAHIDEKGICEGLIEGLAAFLHALRLRYDSNSIQSATRGKSCHYALS